MQTDDPFTKYAGLFNDAAVLVLTVFTGAILLTAAHWFNLSAQIQSQPLPELAMPLPPTALAPLPKIMLVEAPDETDSETPEPKLTSAVHEPVATFTVAETAFVEAPSARRFSLKETVPFHGLIVQAAGRYQVDPHLIQAIIFAESGYNPNAESEKGARGLMQLMPLTAKSLGIRNVLDPKENIDGGVRYFRSLLDRFDNDVQLALAAYNAGSRHVRNYEGVPPFKATQLYIKKVLKFHKRFKSETTSQNGGIA